MVQVLHLDNATACPVARIFLKLYVTILSLL